MIKAVIFDMYETLITLYGSPVYFSRQMAEDVGISEDIFTPMWRMTEDDRTTGKVTVDEVVERILRENNCYSEEKVRLVMDKKIRYKKEAFEHMHPEIILMMRALKEHGIKIGLISNCHSEESTVIKESVLYPYFDAVCLSYDEGIKKPDLEIFKRCLEKICLNANECLYVGDGGSNELAAAKNVGMKPAQAVWYLKEGSMQPVGRLKEFVNIEAPLGVIDFVHKNIAGATMDRTRSKKDDVISKLLSVFSSGNHDKKEQNNTSAAKTADTLDDDDIDMDFIGG